MNDLIKLREAAEILGIHVNTVRNLIKSGQLPVYRLGTKLLRLKKTEVLALLVKEDN